MLEVAFTQYAGSRGFAQQDALYNGQSQIQKSNAKSDAFLLGECPAIFAVSGGVAASSSPAAASKLIIAELVKQGPAVRLLGNRVRQIHQALCNRYASTAKRGTSATLVAARIAGSACELVNVGDSRGYMIRQGGGWQQLSHDHTVMNELLASGEIHALEGVEYAQIYDGLAHCLTADHEEHDFPVHYWQGSFDAGDSLLLCSDGLHDVVSDKQIQALYDSGRSAQDQVQLWRQAVLDAGAPDNLSMVFIRRQMDK